MEFELWYLLIVPILFFAGWWCRGKDQQHRDKERQSRAYFKGVNLLLNDQPDKAIDALIEVVKLDPETIELHHALGNLFSRRGEFDRAVRIHNHLVNRADLSNSERSLALYELGQDYLKAGIFDRAEEGFNRLMNEPEYRLDAMRALLKIFCTEKEWFKAIEMAARLEKEAGENHQIDVAHYYCELADGSLRQKKLEEAKEFLKQALNSDRQSVRALIALGDIAMLEQNAELALSYWTRVEQVSPDHMALVIARMAQAYEQIGHHEQATNIVHRALSDYPGPETLLIASEFIAKTEGPQAAQHLLKEALTNNPNLLAFELLAEMRLKERPDDVELQLLVKLLKPEVSRIGRYQCTHCGFQARSFQWSCPGCSSWGSYPPKRY